MINEFEHIDLTVGVDGNAAFALFGENLQEGEAEFVEIEPPHGVYQIKQAKCLALYKLALRVIGSDE